ncbi:NAD(P)-dependent oxidoreductase [uncultured Subdoligranulum sp.]|uniref:NAD-dependent epimerase/dehydratase family protein n=1 Tax=uncultured Subdoligranulum sp. TaxID=512298 RepID=UPI0026304DF4|nr:NAD(P)-dependent oxidoreductase [uncultured Subdoligranulum sp.]
MKKVIITGPTGAVGVSLIQELIAHNIEVTAICRPASKRLSSIPKHPLVRIVECGVDQLLTLKDQLDHDYDAFYHFAWDGTYGDSRQDLYRQANNILYTLDAVHLAHAAGCSVFVGAGSQSEFGHVEGVLHPDMPCAPDNGYGIAKLDAGRMSRLECRKLGIRHEWCRIVSLYGPFDGQYTMVMSGIYKMLRGERPQYTKGDQVWDYIYSKDASRAFRLVAEKGKDGSIYCFGTGKPRLLKDYILAIRDAVNPELEVGLGELPYYPNQVMHLEADISNLTKDTGFVPQYSFEEGIRETVEWARSNSK